MMNAAIARRLLASSGLLAGLFLGVGLARADALLSCPPNVEFTPAVTVVDPPAGWQPRPWPEIHFLSGARLYDGDPAELAQLREERGPSGSYGWTLERSAPDRPFVLVCTYEGTEMTLVAAVPAAAQRCLVRVVPEEAQGVRYGRVVTGRERTEAVCE